MTEFEYRIIRSVASRALRPVVVRFSGYRNKEYTTDRHNTSRQKTVQGRTRHGVNCVPAVRFGFKRDLSSKTLPQPFPLDRKLQFTQRGPDWRPLPSIAVPVSEVDPYFRTRGLIGTRAALSW
jgi:hypothetical protein